MNWEEARVICTEDNQYQRWIMEAVEIRKRPQDDEPRRGSLDAVTHLERRPRGGRYGGVLVLSNLAGRPRLRNIS